MEGRKKACVNRWMTDGCMEGMLMDGLISGSMSELGVQEWLCWMDGSVDVTQMGGGSLDC